MLVLAPSLLGEPSMIIKILCIFGLAGCHGLFARMRRNLENDKMPYSPKTYKIWNEVPTLLMVIIVFMAIVKPDFTWTVILRSIFPFKRAIRRFAGEHNSPHIRLWINCI